MMWFFFFNLQTHLYRNCEIILRVGSSNFLFICIQVKQVLKRVGSYGNIKGKLHRAIKIKFFLYI